MQLPAEYEPLLSKPDTKAGKTQRVVFTHVHEREERGDIPSTGRFVFYELEQQGMARKPDPNDKRRNRRRSIGWPPGSQDVTDALLVLRDVGAVPWDWILDGERTLFVPSYADSVVDWLAAQVRWARIDCW